MASPRPEGRPLRVALVISNLEYGGAQRQVIELANAADPDRMDVHICSLSGYVPLSAELKEAERRLHIVSKTFKFDVSVIPRLAILLRRLRVDVAQGYLFDSEIATRLAGFLGRVPLVVGSERNTNYYLKRRQLAAYRVTRSLVDIIIANSKAGANFNAKTLGQSTEKYRVVHNGVNTSVFRPRDRRACRAALGIGETEPVVGMFASFKRQKNHPLLFEAAKWVLESEPRTKFMFVGDQLYGGMHGSDQYKEHVQRLLDDLHLRPNCLFVGNRDDVDRLYNVCDITVLPSLFEGTPNAALESMACGVPVIATDVADNALVIPDGVAGFVVPLGDGKVLASRILRLLQDESLRTQMASAARSWVEREFSTGRLVDKTEQIFRQALADAAQ